jgi:hypothetical protein
MSLYSSKLVTRGAATTTTADFFKKLRRLKRVFMAHTYNRVFRDTSNEAVETDAEKCERCREEPGMR